MTNKIPVRYIRPEEYSLYEVDGVIYRVNDNDYNRHQRDMKDVIDKIYRNLGPDPIGGNNRMIQFQETDSGEFSVFIEAEEVGPSSIYYWCTLDKLDDLIVDIKMEGADIVDFIHDETLVDRYKQTRTTRGYRASREKR